MHLSSSCSVRIAATAMLLASVVNTACQPESNVHSTGNVERACFSTSKLACASGIHTNRTVWLPSAISCVMSFA
jgi:hypothetical protein